jgi:hypothetical protein
VAYTFFLLAKRSVAFPPIDRRGIWTCCEGWLTRGVLGVRIRRVIVVLKALTTASRPRILSSMEDIRFVHIQQSYYFSDRLSEAHSLQLALAELGRSPLASWFSRRTQYCLWSCLTDAVRSDAVALARPISRHVAGRNKIEYYRSALHAGGAVIHVRKP